MQLEWDPEIDTPATIAVIGGGPVGVEAALYARFLGYSVLLLDAAKVGHRPLAWGASPLPLPWGEATSSLGLAALAAQTTAKDLPPAEQRVSYAEYVERYLLPLARTDLLYDAVHIHSPVRSVSRTSCGVDSPPSLERRAEQEFRLLIDSQQRGEYTQLADIVLDCSGVGPAQGLATGGGLAVGETGLWDALRLGKIDVLGKFRADFAGRHTLLFGSDAAACANALDFAQLVAAEQATPEQANPEQANPEQANPEQANPGLKNTGQEGAAQGETRLTWVLPKRIGVQGNLLTVPRGDFAELERAAGQLIAAGDPRLVVLPAWGIETLARPQQWAVRLQVGEDETLDLSCDELIHCGRPAADWSFTHGLITDAKGTHCVTPEPHYYVLGQKALGPTQACTFRDARQQIREVFALIGGREDLDLYQIVR
ncbi:MAG: hypothetical protein KDA45_02120 [Planctomycetales bacterium]|nr:hypothetical protein [Planctomycetales bacterium]